MKKLLALILCVMMFVSVIPTMAFAATDVATAQKNYDAAQKAAADALKASQKTFAAKDKAKADVDAIKPLLNTANTDYTNAKNTYTTNPTEANKKAVDLAAAKRDSLKSDYDKAVAAQKAADAAYAADLRAENIANKELAVAQAELTYAQTPNAANHAAIAVAEADLASFLATNPGPATATYDTSKAVAKADPKLKADLESAADYKKQVEKMIENTKKNVATAYGALAMNQVVYASAKSMDDVIGGLVDQIADMLAGKTVNGHKFSSADVNAFKDAHKASVRSVIEDIVIEELKDNEYKYVDKDGKIDPLKYGYAVSDAVNKALNNEDFQAGYQAVATYYAMMNVADSINEELKKQRDEFKGSIDSSFDKDFADNYSRLAAEYIDTLAETGGFDADNFPWTAYITPEVGKQS